MTVLRMPPTLHDGPPADPDDAAVYWSARRRLGLVSQREEAAFRAWLEVPVHAAAFETADRPMDLLGDLAVAPEIRRMREAALLAAPHRRSTRSGWKIAGGLLAASLVGAILIGVLTDGRTFEPGGARGDLAPTASGTTTGSRYATAVGERLDVTLDDGSVVTLNTASVVEVGYTARTRGVRLVQGQALFRVAHQSDRPFVVAAGDRRIIARGTAFDVRLTGDDVRVVLVEGHVDVEPTTRRGLERVIPLLSQQTLSPGERLDAPRTGPVRVTAADVERTTSWRRGQAVFHDDPLAAAVAEMNRYSNHALVIDDPRVAALRVSGVFGVARPENFVAAITARYPVESVRHDDRTTVLRWRDAG